MCDVDDEAVVAAVDAPSIYDIPKVLHSEGLDAYVVRRLEPAVPRRRLDAAGTSCCERVHHPDEEVRVALVGKYIDLPDAYLSVAEALRAGGFDERRQGQHPLGRVRRLRDAGGRRRATSPTSTRCCVPGGFGVRGIEGKVGALRYAREHQIPTLGLCLGLQCMVIEFARNVAGLRTPGPPSSTRTPPSR